MSRSKKKKPTRDTQPRAKSQNGVESSQHSPSEKQVFELPTFASMAQCAAATGVPLAALKMAKSLGCDGFQHSRVDFGRFVRWWFSNQIEDADKDWGRELKRAQAMREQIRLAEDQKRVIDFTTVEEFLHQLMSNLFGSLDRMMDTHLPSILKGLDEASIRKRGLEEVGQLRANLEASLQEWEGRAK